MVAYELIMGASQPLIKPILTIVSPSQFLYLRYLIAGVILLPLVLVRLSKTHRMSLGSFLYVLLTETIGVLNLLLLYTGLKYVTSLQSSLIVNTRPIFMTLVGVLFLAEHEEKHEWMGLGLSVLGTAFILLQPILNHQTDLGNFSFFGMGMIVVTNIFFTIISSLVKKHYGKIDKLTISGIHMWIGIGLFFLYLSASDSLPDLAVMLNPLIALGVLFMSLLGSVLGLALSNYAYTHIEASEASLFIYLQPLVYLPLSVLWLHESISLPQIAGMLLILLGVWWAGRRPRKAAQKQVRLGKPVLARIRLAEVPSERPSLFSRHH